MTALDRVSIRFPTAKLMEPINVPVLVMHGDADAVIPFALGRELYDRLAMPKQFFVVRGGDHNDAQAPDEQTYWNTVDRFVEQMAASAKR